MTSPQNASLIHNLQAPLPSGHALYFRLAFLMITTKKFRHTVHALPAPTNRNSSLTPSVYLQRSLLQNILEFLDNATNDSAPPSIWHAGHDASERIVQH